MAGIEPIPKGERNLGGWDFFLLWAGAAISLAEIWAGGLIVPLGLGLGLWAILLGHLIGNTPFALGGLIGSRWGIPTMVSVRPSFGIRGSYFAAALNVIQLIGWTAVMLIVCGQAADAISKFYGFSNLNLWIILSGIITTLWAVVGHRIWKWLQRIAVFALLILCLAMTYVVFQQYGWGMLSQIPRKRGFPFYGGHGSYYRHAHLMAPFSFGLFTLCQGFKVKFLGDLDQLFYCLFLDVSYRSDGFSCHPIP